MPSVGDKGEFNRGPALHKPDFLCIGAQKSATSWLNKLLLEHPHVYMPPVNELHYFDRVNRDAALRPRQVQLARRAIKREEKKKDTADRAYIAFLERLIAFPTVTREWYEAAYSWPVGEGVKKGDITPSYLELNKGKVAYARRFLGPTRLILIVRRPADRLLSQMRMWADRNCETPPDDQEWMTILERAVTREKRGSYSTGVPLWRENFGADNLLVIPFSDIRNHPTETIVRVEDHIGIPHFDGFTLLSEKVHATKKYDISDSVKRAAQEVTQTEADYLLREFGEEFFEKTR